MEDNTRFDQIQKTIETINDFSNSVSEMLASTIQTFQSMVDQITKTLATDFMQGVWNTMQSFAQSVHDTVNDPDSYFSHTKYQKGLDNFHWAWPYEIRPEELKELLEGAENEKEFDRLMGRFFNGYKLDKMFLFLSDELPKHHKTMIQQVQNGYKRRDYAIASNALMSILDNLLSAYMYNKGKTQRSGILEPMVEFYENDFPLNEIPFIFELCMLSNNINFIFRRFDFNEMPHVDSNKKAYRHPSVHGVQYTNKRIDMVMLLNTLCALTRFKEILKSFENGLMVRKDGSFVFSDRLQEKINVFRCKQMILDVLEINGQARHKDFLEFAENILPNEIADKGKYLSNILQRMKKTDKIIISKRIDGQTYWVKTVEVKSLLKNDTV